MVRTEFNSNWSSNCVVTAVGIAKLDDFIKAHYLQKRPAIVLASLGMFHHGTLVGCCVFSAPPREASVRYGGETWELARLYIIDRMPKMSESWLIGQSIRWVMKNHPEVQFLLSYADPSAGHSGTIYRATNWTYDGMTDSDRKTPRCDYVDARTGKKYGRRGNMPEGAIVERRPRVSKHRFVFPMVKRRSSQQRRELQCN